MGCKMVPFWGNGLLRGFFQFPFGGLWASLGSWIVLMVSCTVGPSPRESSGASVRLSEARRDSRAVPSLECPKGCRRPDYNVKMHVFKRCPLRSFEVSSKPSVVPCGLLGCFLDLTAALWSSMGLSSGSPGRLRSSS